MAVTAAGPDHDEGGRAADGGPVPTAVVVRTFLAVKWRFLRRTRQPALAVLAAVVGLLLAGYGFLTFASARFASSDLDRAWPLLAGCTVVVLGWSLGPVLVGVEEAVDPRRLATVPLAPLSRVVGMLAAASMGVGQVAVALALLGIPVGFAPVDPAALLVLCVPPLVFVQGLVSSRVVAALLAGAQRTRAGRDLAVVLASLTGFSGVLAVQVVANAASFDRALVARAVDVLEVLPPGWAAQVALQARDGRPLTAAAFAALSLGWSGLLLVAWARLTARLVVDDGRAQRRRARTGRPGRAVLGGAGTPFGVVLAREVRYLWRSPMRRVTAVTGVVVGSVFGLVPLFTLGGDAEWHVFLAAGAVVMVAGSCTNLLGLDATALWMEVVCGGPTARTLVARAVVWLPVVVLPVLVAATVAAVRTGGWGEAAATVVMTAACAPLVGAVGVRASLAAPVHTPDDANPFVRHDVDTGQGCIAGIQQLVAMVVVAALAAVPVLVAVGLAAVLPAVVAVGVAAAAAAVGSVALLAWSGRVTARHLRGREPELLGLLAVRPSR